MADVFTALHDLFVGLWVDVDAVTQFGSRNSDGGRARIMNIDEDKNITVKYVIGDVTSPNVRPSRIHHPDFVLTGRRNARSSASSSAPSLLSHLYGEYRAQQIINQPPPVRRTRIVDLPVDPEINTSRLLSLLLVNSNLLSVVKLIKNKNTEEGNGWLRKVESNTTIDKRKTYLNEKEKDLVLKLLIALKPKYRNTTSIVSDAWGVDSSTVRRMLITVKKSTNFTIARKKRVDTGQTILNSKEKCESIITEKRLFRQLKEKQTINGRRPNACDIYSSWMSLNDYQMRQLTRTTEEQKNRCQTLIFEIGKVLRDTRGAITWREVTNQITGNGAAIISYSTLRRNIMKLPNSTYTRTKILPRLDDNTRNKRLHWAKAFFIFWNEAKKITNVFVVLVHMDEKWFYSTVVRKHNKYVPFLGMEKPTYLRVNKKNHIHKEMYICSTAYIPNDNNISTGGLLYTHSCERVGHFVPAQKNTYRRVYADDGSYTYPRIEANISRRRGQMYFESLEITGSTEGNVSKPKYSLLNFFLDIEIPKLEELTDDITARYGHRAVVRYQMDNAGPHVEVNFSNRLQEEFNRRGWMLMPQPPNSPITNIKDAAIFPALSKKSRQYKQQYTTTRC